MGQKVSLQLSFANFTPYKWERASNEPGLLSCWELPEAVEPYSVTKSDPIQFPSDSVTEHGINVDSIEVLSQKPLCNPITTYNFVDEKGESRKIEICGSLESKTIFAVVIFPTQNTNDKTVNLMYIENNQWQGTFSFAMFYDGKNYLTNLHSQKNWMADNISLIGGKTLGQICIPGSHDSGMSKCVAGTTMSNCANTQNHTNSVNKQLELGVRFFDIRPIIGGGEYHTGHYTKAADLSWQGSRGQSMAEIISDVNQFTSEAKGELIILNLSHDLNTDVGNMSYRPFVSSEWNQLLSMLKDEQTGIRNLYRNSKQDVDLTNETLIDLIGKGSKVMIVIEAEDYSGIEFDDCFFKFESVKRFDKYADTNDFNQMMNDQFEKLKANSQKYFLLSWTLTLSAWECVIDGIRIPVETILELANEANRKIWTDLYGKSLANDSCLKPNIIYMDNIVDSSQVLLCLKIAEA